MQKNKVVCGFGSQNSEKIRKTNVCFVSTLNYSLFNWDWAEQERQKERRQIKNQLSLNEHVNWERSTLWIFSRDLICIYHAFGKYFLGKNLQAIGTAVKYGCWNGIGNGDGDG